MIKNAYCSPLKSARYSCQILMKLESRNFEFRNYRKKKHTQISYFMKIRPVGNELFHADGQTDMTKLIVGCAILRTRLKRLIAFSNLLAELVTKKIYH